MYYLVLTKFNMRFGNINSLLLVRIRYSWLFLSLVLVWIIFFMFWPSQQPLNWAIKWSKLLKYRYNWLVWLSALQLELVLIIKLCIMNCILYGVMQVFKKIKFISSNHTHISISLLVSYCQSIMYRICLLTDCRKEIINM